MSGHRGGAAAGVPQEARGRARQPWRRLLVRAVCVALLCGSAGCGLSAQPGPEPLPRDRLPSPFDGVPAGDSAEPSDAP
ncbi:hypothetical protein [Nocardioides mesophilus]|uniref:Uncharacterized protein n=1 Tax=Nocardioides mesophilus TaxID=433659 RepID=A0A7G9RE09_9ACTN|nr:hypothetical protein [Nocardioides mesophilus]QNN53834.1 hypothetical protein H9L09_05385 [Nocardioides mesophilus]